METQFVDQMAKRVSKTRILADSMKSFAKC